VPLYNVVYEVDKLGNKRLIKRVKADAVYYWGTNIKANTKSNTPETANTITVDIESWKNRGSKNKERVVKERMLQYLVFHEYLRALGKDDEPGPGGKWKLSGQIDLKPFDSKMAVCLTVKEIDSYMEAIRQTVTVNRKARFKYDYRPFLDIAGSGNFPLLTRDRTRLYSLNSYAAQREHIIEEYNEVWHEKFVKLRHQVARRSSRELEHQTVAYLMKYFASLENEGLEMEAREMALIKEVINKVECRREPQRELFRGHVDLVEIKAGSKSVGKRPRYSIAAAVGVGGPGYFTYGYIGATTGIDMNPGEKLAASGHDGSNAWSFEFSEKQMREALDTAIIMTGYSESQFKFSIRIYLYEGEPMDRFILKGLDRARIVRQIVFSNPTALGPKEQSFEADGGFFKIRLTTK